MSRRSDNLLIYGLVVVMLAGAAWFFLGPGGESTPTVTAGEAGIVADLDMDLGASTTPLIDATISTADLPVEAIDTMLLIDSGGPYPYSKDGSVFQNREGRLPDRPGGYYREYTVDTPGSPDRGARRIVGGDDGELFYTSDHYDSFSQIVG